MKLSPTTKKAPVPASMAATPARLEVLCMKAAI
jgi:hypothetical protein